MTRVLSAQQRALARERSYQWRIRQMATDAEGFHAAERQRIATRRERGDARVVTRPAATPTPRERRSAQVIAADIAVLLARATQETRESPPTATAPPLFAAVPSFRDRLRAKRQPAGSRLHGG